MNRVTVFLLAFILILGVSAQRNNVNDLSNDSPSKVARASARSLLLPPVEIECYVCSNCKTVLNSTATKICPINPLETTKTPKCVTFIEKYKGMEDSWYIRGCVSERGNCDEIKKISAEVGVTVSDCKECSGDRCNFDTMTQSFPKIIAFCSLVIVPLLKTFALS